MKTIPPLCLLPLLLTAGLTAGSAAPAAAAAGEPIRIVEQTIPLDGARAVKAKIKSGDLAVTGWDQDRIEAKVEIYCDGSSETDCRQAAQRISVRWKRKGSTLAVEVLGTTKLRARHIEVRAVLRVPAGRPLETDTVAGDVRIGGLTSDVEVDIGTGDADLTFDRRHVRVVELDVGAGEAALYLDGARIEGAGFLHRGVTWRSGEGAAIVEVDIGAGDAIVRLQ